MKPSVQRKVHTFVYYSGPVALLIVLLVSAFLVATRPPSPVNTYRALSKSASAEYFAKDVFRTWISGKGGGPDFSPSEKKIDGMVSSIDKLRLSGDPVRLTGYTVTDVERNVSSDGRYVQWAYEITASMVIPGGAVSTNRFRVTFLESDGAYQVIALPYMIPNSVVPMKVDSVYAMNIDHNSVLFKRIEGFSKAYLAGKQTRTDISGYVTSDFNSGAVQNTPYTDVKVSDAKAASDKEPAGAGVGETFQVMVTAKVYLTVDSFVTMQLPLTVVQPKDGQWAVQSVDTIVDFGEVHGR